MTPNIHERIGENAGHTSHLLSKLNHDLNLIVVDPNQGRCQDLKKQLLNLDHVSMVGMRRSPIFLMDTFNEYSVDLVLFDEEVGWENIVEAVREVRIHPGAENTGYLMIANSVGPEMVRIGAHAGLLGFLQKPYNEALLVRSILDGLGEPDPNLRPLLEEMRGLKFFSSFTDRDLLRLLNMCNTRTLAPGEALFNEGEPGDSMAVILSGTIQVSRNLGNTKKLLSKLGAGSCIGEMAVLDNQSRSADATALVKTIVYEIDQRTLNDDNRLALKLSRQIGIEMAAKIRTANQHL
ncbi:MAG: cyclic nucleotide-binding domain-containing protein [Deltaproteobacteria bacterium]|nr:cyclic nucleotide-binding domain-containing protein [Deltaproteobacteria bacterium]